MQRHQSQIEIKQRRKMNRNGADSPVFEGSKIKNMKLGQVHNRNMRIKEKIKKFHKEIDELQHMNIKKFDRGNFKTSNQRISGNQQKSYNYEPTLNDQFGNSYEHQDEPLENKYNKTAHFSYFTATKVWEFPNDQVNQFMDISIEEKQIKNDVKQKNYGQQNKMSAHDETLGSKPYLGENKLQPNQNSNMSNWINQNNKEVEIMRIKNPKAEKRERSPKKSFRYNDINLSGLILKNNRRDNNIYQKFAKEQPNNSQAIKPRIRHNSVYEQLQTQLKQQDLTKSWDIQLYDDGEEQSSPGAGKIKKNRRASCFTKRQFQKLPNYQMMKRVGLKKGSVFGENKKNEGRGSEQKVGQMEETHYFMVEQIHKLKMHCQQIQLSKEEEVQIFN